MMISFACPSCGASGSVDEAFIGRQVRCKPCQHRFVIPSPVEPADEAGYLLDDPMPVGGSPVATKTGAVFVPSRGEEPTVFVAPKKPAKKRKPRREAPEIAWGAWFVRGGIVGAVALVAIALIAPRGVEIVGTILLGLGSLMFLAGFAVGAFGAFFEDFLYGFLYLVVPFYPAYYMLTRWDDLRNWAIGSTAGVGLIMVGTEMLRRAGVME